MFAKLAADKQDTMALIEEIQRELFSLQDKKYRDFLIPLIPSVDASAIIGVRTPLLRRFAKQVAKNEEADEFLHSLPHRYFDENQLHSFIISDIKDFDALMSEVCRFLPFIDNWATCDQFSPKLFKQHRAQLLCRIKDWIAGGKTYTIRFAVLMLMKHFLDDDFNPSYLSMVSLIKSDEYYVKMMVAWYFAEALSKQYGASKVFIEKRILDPWTHRKAISKALESNKITLPQKAYLRTLK